MTETLLSSSRSLQVLGRTAPWGMVLHIEDNGIAGLSEDASLCQCEDTAYVYMAVANGYERPSGRRKPISSRSGEITQGSHDRRAIYRNRC